jgi:hypothetical protein
MMMTMMTMILINIHNSLIINRRNIEIFESMFDFLKFVNNEIREMMMI